MLSCTQGFIKTYIYIIRPEVSNSGLNGLFPQQSASACANVGWRTFQMHCHLLIAQCGLLRVLVIICLLRSGSLHWISSYSSWLPCCQEALCNVKDRMLWYEICRFKDVLKPQLLWPLVPHAATVATQTWMRCPGRIRVLRGSRRGLRSPVTPQMEPGAFWGGPLPRSRNQ